MKVKNLPKTVYKFKKYIYNEEYIKSYEKVVIVGNFRVLKMNNRASIFLKYKIYVFV